MHSIWVRSLALSAMEVRSCHEYQIAVENFAARAPIRTRFEVLNAGTRSHVLLPPLPNPRSVGFKTHQFPQRAVLKSVLRGDGGRLVN